MSKELKPWYAVATPHEDIQKGRLSEAVFAANLWAVVQGTAPEVYTDPDAFFAIVDRHPQVRVILWGHVHQEFAQRRNEVLLLAAPSTCLQFLPGSERFAVEEIPPGYRWLDLYPDGTLKTGIERLAQMPGSIDLSARGY